MTSSWARWRLKSPAYVLSTQPFIHAQIKENIKAPHHWLCEGNSPMNSQHKGIITRKSFPFDDVIMFMRFTGRWWGHNYLIFYINSKTNIFANTLVANRALAQIEKYMGPTWGPPGPCRPQMGPMLALWTLLPVVHRHLIPPTGRYHSWSSIKSKGTHSLSMHF